MYTIVAYVKFFKLLTIGKKKKNSHPEDIGINILYTLLGK